MLFSRLYASPFFVYNMRCPVDNIHHPHDKGYKYLFSRKENVLELLQSFVQADWVRHVDAARMSKVDKTGGFQVDQVADLTGLSREELAKHLRH